MDHSILWRTMPDFFAGELSSEDARELEAHLAACPRCRQTREELVAEERALEAMDDETRQDFLFDAAESGASGQGRQRRAGRTGMSLAAGAGALLLLAIAEAGGLVLGERMGADEADRLAQARQSALVAEHQAELARRDADARAAEAAHRQALDAGRAPAGARVASHVPVPPGVAALAGQVGARLAGFEGRGVSGEVVKSAGGWSGATEFTSFARADWDGASDDGAVRSAVLEALRPFGPRDRSGSGATGRGIPPAPAAVLRCGDGVASLARAGELEVFATTDERELGRFLVARRGQLALALVCEEQSGAQPSGGPAQAAPCAGGFKVLRRSDEDPIVQSRFRQVAACAASTLPGRQRPHPASPP